MSIEVIKPGMYSIFQDLGRVGYQRFGVHVNGVMDERAHRLANLLVGNAHGDATLEIMLMGPSLAFRVPVTIALCGADLSPMVNGEPIAMDRTVDIATGDVLSFGKRINGLRSYLAVRGGFALPSVMGSSSTNARARFGGLNGMQLRKGDLIELRAPALTRSRVAPGPFPADIAPAADAPIRLLAGREWVQFSEDSQRLLLEETYTITPQSDRMGYRLSGAKLGLGAAREMLSETVSFGTIQVPPDGQPIILMADRGTSGGYPRIANVISVDLPRLAQKMPGESLRFELVELDEAQALAVRQRSWFM